jgi:hypothetical protein
MLEVVTRFLMRGKTEVHFLPQYANIQRVQRRMRATIGTEPVRKAFEVDLIELSVSRLQTFLVEKIMFQFPPYRGF